MIPVKQLKLVIPRSDSVKYEAVQILINDLGLTKTAFFIRENLSHQDDYLEMKEKLFGEQTAANIYNEMKNLAKD